MSAAAERCRPSRSSTTISSRRRRRGSRARAGRLFPGAPIHTTFFERDRFASRIDPAGSAPGRWSSASPPRPWFRPLFPAYVAHFSRLEVPASRLVISNSSTFARGGARPAAGASTWPTSTRRCVSPGTSMPISPIRASRGRPRRGSTSSRPVCACGTGGRTPAQTWSSPTRKTSVDGSRAVGSRQPGHPPTGRRGRRRGRSGP